MGKEIWRIRGYDEFEGEYYRLTGEFVSEDVAKEAALAQFKLLAITQPHTQSGGQDDFGIQDRVFVVRPDGTQYRFIPVEPEQFVKLQTD